MNGRDNDFERQTNTYRAKSIVSTQEALNIEQIPRELCSYLYSLTVQCVDDRDVKVRATCHSGRAGCILNDDVALWAVTSMKEVRAR